jgi:hypothetical protein
MRHCASISCAYGDHETLGAIEDALAPSHGLKPLRFTTIGWRYRGVSWSLGIKEVGEGSIVVTDQFRR